MAKRILVKNGRFMIRGKRMMAHKPAIKEDLSVEGGSVQSFMKRVKNSPSLGASGMESTIKRNLQRTKEVLGNTSAQVQQSVQGGTMMTDPLQSVSLPKFSSEGKKMKRNNIKISL